MLLDALWYVQAFPREPEGFSGLSAARPCSERGFGYRNAAVGGGLCGEGARAGAGKPPGAFALVAMGRWELWWCGGSEGPVGRQGACGCALLGCV